MDDNNSILIDRYLNNQLSTQELLEFEKHMHDDVAFKAEVELHKEIVEGISGYGKKLMRAEIAAAGIEAKGNLENYKPSKGGGNWLWSLTKWLVFLGAVGAIAYVVLWQNSERAVDPHTESEIEQVEKDKGGFQSPVTAPGQSSRYTTTETIYHTIKTQTVKPGDTLIFTSEEEMKEYLRTHEGAHKSQ